MIKLKSVLFEVYGLKTMSEKIEDVEELFESPMVIGKWSGADFSDNGINYLFSKKMKEMGKKIDSFEIYDVYEMVTGKEHHFGFLGGELFDAYFIFEVILPTNSIIEKVVWQRISSVGLARRILFDYFLNKYNSIVSDDLHTTDGKRYWKKNLVEARRRNLKTFVLKNGVKHSIDDKTNIEQFWSRSTSSGDYRLVIEK